MTENQTKVPSALPLDFEARADKAKLPIRAWLRLYSCATQIEREISSRLQVRFGVSLARFDYLAQLSRQPGTALTMGELGQCLMVTGGSITGLTDRLEADGLVAREANPADRRSHLIVMTEKGHAVFSEMSGEHAAWLSELLSDMNEADLKKLMSGLDRVKSGIQRAAERRTLRKGGRK